MQLLHPFRYRGADQRANHGLRERPVECEVGYGDVGGGREAALVGGVIAPKRPDVVQGPRFAAHDPTAGGEVRVRGVSGLGVKYRLVETRRQRIDQVDIAGELAVLLLCDAGGNEDAEVTDAFMNGVDDGLTVGADLIDALVQVQYPSERLLGRRDVVAFRAKRHDGSANIAQIDRGAVRGLNTPGGEVVADEQLVDDELDLLRVQVDVSAPPALEAQIARGLGVDLGIEIVLLGPQGVGGILILEILHQPSAIEFSVAEIADEGGQPAATEQTAAVAHRVLAVHAGPVRQRRAGNDDRAEQFGADGGEHHDRPSR